MHRLLLVSLILALITPLVRAQDVLRFDDPLETGLKASYTLQSEHRFEIKAPFLPGGGQDDAFTQTVVFDLEVLGEVTRFTQVRMVVRSIEVDAASSLLGAGRFAGRADEAIDMERLGDGDRRLARAFRNAIGQDYVLVLDSDRMITTVRKPEGVLKGLSRDERNAYERVLGTDRLREALQPLLRPLGAPGEMPRDGSWDHNFNRTNALGQLSFSSTYTLESMNDQTARFTMEGTIHVNAEGMGGNLTVERDLYEGELVWDRAEGLARQVRSSVDSRYTMSEEPPIKARVTIEDRLVRTDGVTDEPPHARGPEALEDLLKQAVARFSQPAIGAAVVNADGLVAIGVSGTRVAGVDLPVTRDDRWHIGSCSKAMTATLLAQALEGQKALTLQSTLSEVFPELADRMHPRYRGATIADVLAHTSGVPALTNGAAPDRAALKDLPEDPRAARAAFAERLLTASDTDPYAPVGVPGGYAYSNAGFGIAAAITERLLDAPWEDAMRDRLFDALGMSSAGFGWPSAISASGEPRGHYAGLAGATPRQTDDPYHLDNAIVPAGDVHASIGDWVKFAQDRLRTLEGMDDSPLLDPEHTLALLTPAAGATYAGGWGTGNLPTNGRLYAHDGSAGTFYCTVWIMPDADLAVLVVSNSGDGAQACEAVRGRLVERYGGE